MIINFETQLRQFQNRIFFFGGGSIRIHWEFEPSLIAPIIIGCSRLGSRFVPGWTCLSGNNWTFPEVLDLISHC